MSDNARPTSANLTEELNRITKRIAAERAGLSTALAAERETSAELRRKVEKLTDDASSARERERRDQERIDRLTETNRHQERHYQGVLAERDMEIKDLRAQREELGGDWSARFLRLSQSHEREVGALSSELVTARQDIDALQSEVAVLLTGSSADADKVDGRGAVYLVDGDSVVRSIWPDHQPESSRAKLVVAAERYGKQTGTKIDLLFDSSVGLDALSEDLSHVRVRVPRPDVAMVDALRGLNDAQEEKERRMRIVSDEPEFPQAVAPSYFGARLGLRSTDRKLPALEATTTLDLPPENGVVAADRS